MLPGAAAEPQAGKDDPAAKEKSKEKKPGVKRADTTPAGRATGKIAHLDGGSFALEGGSGYAKRSVHLPMADDVKVRVLSRLEFDEKGKPKQPKPDPDDPDRKYGGVKGDRSDLHDGQAATVMLGKLPDKRLVATVIIVADQKK
jgi:hypothetical protein